jgi:phosphatidate cytidylyltransferase
MMARIATALVGIPIVLYAVCAGNLWPLRMFLAIIGIVALLEFSRLAGRSVWLLLIGAGYLVALLIWNPAEPALPWILALLVIPLVDAVSKDLPRLFLAAGWIFLPLLSAISLRATSLPEAPHWGLDFEQNVLLLVFLCLWAGDSMAFFAGSIFGKHKLAPKVSPGKTWEGAVANLIACTTAGWAFSSGLNLPAEFGIQIGLVCGILGQLGDLYQSSWKRRFEVKDSGALLPGHGGVLDRFDSLLFCLPAANTIAYLWRI